jgi:beta-glucosidase
MDLKHSKEEKIFIFQGFYLRTATASYQIEGAVAADGKTLQFGIPLPTPLAALWTEQPATSLATTITAGRRMRRCSRNWERTATAFALLARIFPQRRRYNAAGMVFYRTLLKDLQKRGVRPAVTLYHWDLPQWAQDEGGWPAGLVEDFLAYAKVCFEQLDDLVDRWIPTTSPIVPPF